MVNAIVVYLQHNIKKKKKRNKKKRLIEKRYMVSYNLKLFLMIDG